MLVREMLDLDRRGLIPQYLKDAWTKKYGDEYPTMENPRILRLVRIDAWVNANLPPLVIPLFVIAMVSLGACLMHDGPPWTVLCLLLLTLLVSILPRIVTLQVQSRTKTNFFNCSLTNMLKWMKIGSGGLVGFSRFELSHCADEVLIEQAREIIRLEDQVDWMWMGDESFALRDARHRFNFMYERLGDFELVSDPWGRFFKAAHERIAEAKKEAEKKKVTPLTDRQRHEAWAALNEFCSWAWESAAVPSAHMCFQYLRENHPSFVNSITVPAKLGLRWETQRANGKPTLKYRIARLRHFIKMGLKTDHLFPIESHSVR